MRKLMVEGEHDLQLQLHKFQTTGEQFSVLIMKI